MQLDTDTEVPPEAISTARNFGVELGDLPNEPKSYVIAFLKQLLIQREKLEHRVLDKYLKPDTPRWWKKLLSSLEEQNRKLLRVETGSVIFTLFCPTEQSFTELKDGGWFARVINHFQGLLESLGKDYQFRIETRES